LSHEIEETLCRSSPLSFSYRGRKKREGGKGPPLYLNPSAERESRRGRKKKGKVPGLLLSIVVELMRERKIKKTRLALLLTGGNSSGGERECFAVGPDWLLSFSVGLYRGGKELPSAESFSKRKAEEKGKNGSVSRVTIGAIFLRICRVSSGGEGEKKKKGEGAQSDTLQNGGEKKKKDNMLFDPSAQGKGGGRTGGLEISSTRKVGRRRKMPARPPPRAYRVSEKGEGKKKKKINVLYFGLGQEIRKEKRRRDGP